MLMDKIARESGGKFMSIDRRSFKVGIIAGIFLVLRNGRDITPGIYQGGVVNADAGLSDGDVIAFSGPVPYSYGYGAPVV